MHVRRFTALVALFATVFSLALPAQSFAQVIQGHVYSWESYDGTSATGLEGVAVRAYPWTGSGYGAPVTTTTDAQGAYSFDALTDLTYYQVVFADQTGTRRDMSLFQRGFALADGDAYRNLAGEADAYLRLLTDLKANRTRRVAGTSRYATAIQISKTNWDAADTVILASGEGFADALAASPLAGTYRAPLLLTPKAGVPSGLLAELDRLNTTKVIIVGGTGSVSDTVKNQLQSAGITVARIAGTDRYSTAAQIAQEVQDLNGDGYRDSLYGENDEPFICRGDVFADALAVSSFAYAEQRPILLTSPAGPSTAVRNAWNNMKVAANYFVVFIGGPNSMTEPVYMFFDGTETGENNIWLYGEDRYSTGEAIVNFYGGDADKAANPDAWEGYWQMTGGFDRLYVASGANYPDALAGGVAAGYNRGPLLLTTPSTLGAPARRQIQQHGKWVTDMQVYGGTGAVSSTVLSSANTALGTQVYDFDSGLVALSNISASKVPGLLGGNAPSVSTSVPSALGSFQAADDRAAELSDYPVSYRR